MKEFLKNGWVIFWFVLGLVYFVLAIISAINHETDKSIACYAFGMACHARCEVKVLQEKMEDTRDKHRL